jgi:hypothetical protein
MGGSGANPTTGRQDSKTKGCRSARGFEEAPQSGTRLA